MEDIYDDLNNYEDVNCVQELRNENMELKEKLAKHAAAMEKLQKEYDTLEMEFKKLENNYSSLLKTARSEIERKTQRISQLNHEKDMMVLESIKNGKKIRMNFNKGAQNTSNINNEKPYKQKGNKKVEKDDVKPKNIYANIERSETTSVQNFGTEHRDNFPNKYESSGAQSESYNRKSNFKETITHSKTEHYDTPKTFANRIKDRRKSTPAVSMPVEKISSDEEYEKNYNTKDTRVDLPPMKRRNLNIISADRHSNRTSETSSIDDRGSNYHESISRDNYRGRKSRQYDNINRSDKYDTSLKFRKNYSPERGQKRQHREYQDDGYRQDQGRYRPLESPPPDTFRNQLRYQDVRSKYDRHSHDHERNRYRPEDTHVAKKKIPNDYGDPHPKRQKVDSISNIDAHLKEERMYYNERKTMDTQSIPEYPPHEYDMMGLSCQSPDYVHSDAASANPIKEIMATAATPLEDPRVTSTRYVLIKNNDTKTLSTAVGRNIDIKLVDKAEWDIPQTTKNNTQNVRMPDALLRLPSQCNEKLVKDIDDPVTNLFKPSGEVRFESEDKIPGIHKKEKEIPHDIRVSQISKQVSQEFSKQASNAEEILKPDVNKYEMSKIGLNSKNIQNKMDVPIINVGEYVPHKKRDSNKVVSEDIPSEKSITKQKNVEHVTSFPRNTSDSKHEDKRESQNQITLSKMTIVADDLELSDENSDVDSHQEVPMEKVSKHAKVQSDNNKEIRNRDSTSIAEDHSSAKSKDNETKKTIDTVEIKTAKDEKIKEPDDTKKQRSKKKKRKSKEVPKDLLESKDTIPVTKKTRSKIEKEPKHNDTKNKLSDLFGDSCSLMTPEDLGIPSYLPISEDAQDAVDMKIDQIIDATLPGHADIPVDIKAQSSLGIGNQKAATHDNISENVLYKSNTKEKDLKDIQKTKSSHGKDEVVDVNVRTPSIIYENLISRTDSNEPDVVQTIIISTGGQPELTSENTREEVIEKTTADVEVNIKQNITDSNPIPSIMEFKRQNVLKALATSTPHKEVITLNSAETEAIAPKFTCDTNVSKVMETKENVAQVDNQSDSNTLDTHDAPDVIIYMKRRRKPVKRQQIT